VTTTGRALAAACLALLAACAAPERRESPAVIVEARGEPGAGESAAPAPAAAGGAYGELLARALAARGRGDYGAALALLERAQRIDPDSGELYLELARTHAAAGNGTQARAIAERGLLYCRGSECAALDALLD
jgi:hypothetical protein